MSRFDRLKHSKQFITCPGNPMHEVKHGVVKDDGSIELVVDRLENTDELIESFKLSTDIHNIISRIESGQVDLLNQKEGFYGDFVDFPKTYAEMLDLMHRGEEFFNKLPSETKEKFNNDFNQFFANFDVAMKELTATDQKEAQQIVEKEVKTEE